jgi:hypothetical protein
VFHERSPICVPESAFWNYDERLDGDFGIFLLVTVFTPCDPGMKMGDVD